MVAEQANIAVDDVSSGDEKASLIGLIQKQSGVKEAIKRALEEMTLSDLRKQAVAADFETDFQAKLVTWRQMTAQPDDLQAAMYAVDWSPDGRHVASGGKDRNLKIWRR